MTPSVQVTAHVNGVTQTRSAPASTTAFASKAASRCSTRAGFATDGPRVAREALELHAGATPARAATMDLVLMPDQMMLQIHESIGHPLELDRILGDERNYAGTSFVTLDMFGHYRYGSELLNVSFDPTAADEFASFAFDDDGTPAERELLIERGVLQRPLGGTHLAGARPGPGFDSAGVATTRACSWNRAADRSHEQPQRRARRRAASSR